MQRLTRPGSCSTPWWECGDKTWRIGDKDTDINLPSNIFASHQAVQFLSAEKVMDQIISYHTRISFHHCIYNIMFTNILDSEVFVHLVQEYLTFHPLVTSRCSQKGQLRMQMYLGPRIHDCSERPIIWYANAIVAIDRNLATSPLPGHGWEEGHSGHWAGWGARLIKSSLWDADITIPM